MTRRAVSTTAAPGAVGPYSQAIEAGGLVFCAGQIGRDDASGWGSIDVGTLSGFIDTSTGW